MCAALAAPTAHVTATVSDDLRTVTGTIRLDDLSGAELVDALRSLPVPDDVVELSRTFPGVVERGQVVFGPADVDGAVSFTATLPRRWGDVGATRDGLFANGLWYPTPLVRGRLPEVAWDVTVTLPNGAVGAVGDVAGRGVLHWAGTAERTSLAVLRRGTVETVRGDGHEVTVVVPRRPGDDVRPGLRRVLTRGLPLAWQPEHTWRGVLVQTPSRTRLVSSGPGLAYASVRLGRVFPWFSRLHHRPLVEGVVRAWHPSPDPLTRAVAGAAVARVAVDREQRRLRTNWLKLVMWIPAVDNALYNRDMPFQDELLGRTVPQWPVDPLTPRFAPAVSGTWAVAQVEDRARWDAVPALAVALAHGTSLPDALGQLGLDPGLVDTWRTTYPFVGPSEAASQDWTLSRDDAGQLVVVRDAPPTAPPEAVVVQVGDTRQLLEAPAGATTFSLPGVSRRDGVALDPLRHTGQRSREHDVWPVPLRWTLNGQISAIQASQRTVSAFAVLTARGAADTRDRFRLWAITSQRAWLAGRFGWTHFVGPLVRPSERAHALTLGVDGAWLNPNFAPTAGATYSVGGTAQWVYDTHRTSLFPTSGATLSTAVSAGGVPELRASYVRVSATGSGSVSPAPRVVLAGRLSAGWADTELPHERLRFGGEDGVRGLPDAEVQTDVQAVGSLELRTVPVREASWPLGVTYVRDVHVVAGLDFGVGADRGTPVAALGAAFGVGVVVDNLGIAPGAALVTVGVPLWRYGFTASTPMPVTVGVTWGPGF